MRLLPASALVLLLVLPTYADDPPPLRLADSFECLAQFPVDVQEISGWTQIPSTTPSHRTFLAVSDEGRLGDDGFVLGSIYRIGFEVTDAREVAVASIDAVELHLGDQVPRVDPLWATRGGWTPDLESCVALPGTSDLFLVGGERGAEDVSDGGSNRLYVMRYPAGDAKRAEVVEAFSLPDMDDDGINDRIEAVAVLGEQGRWSVFAFKERTAVEGRIPGYFPLLLMRGEQGFALSAPTLTRPPLPTILPSRERLGAQADACVAADGRVWVLDRWRREIHTGLPNDGRLEADVSYDYFDLVEEVPGEQGGFGPAAPGGRHDGYGRQEAMCFDADGWLWLAADLGGGNPSTVTVLAPRRSTLER